jgi:hypothetical protein
MCRSRTIVPAPASVRPASSPIALISVLRMDGNRIAGADDCHRAETQETGMVAHGHLAQRSSPVLAPRGALV